MNKINIFAPLFIAFCVAPFTISASEFYSEDGIECSLCKWGTTEIENFLSSNHTETEIESALTKACSYLPEKYQSVCDNKLVPLVPTIINYLDDHETPDTICGQLHFCSSELVFDMDFTRRSQLMFTRMLVLGSPINNIVKDMIIENIEFNCY